MKKFAFAIVLVAALSVPAHAADVPARTYTKAPPVVAPVYNWSGFYAGANAGGAWTDWNARSIFGPAVLKADSMSGIAGAFIGAQYQWQWLVVGIEGQVATQFSNDGGGSGCPPRTGCAPGTVYTSKFTDALFTAGGRAGVALNRWMPYFTGGYASTNFNYVGFNTVGQNQFAYSKQTIEGYYIGGGVDWAFADSWIVGIEYRHYDFGNFTVRPVSPAGALLLGEGVNAGAKLDTLTARLSYKFNWAGPVVAKY